MQSELKIMADQLLYFIYSLNITRGSVREWLGHSLAVMGVDGSSLLTASITKMLWFELPLRLTVRFLSLRWINVGHLPHSGQG